jgi:hypothetical protein
LNLTPAYHQVGFFIWPAYCLISGMSEEFIKGLSLEQLLQHVIILIDAHVELEKSADNNEAVDQSRALLIMISKEISAKNTSIQQFTGAMV